MFELYLILYLLAVVGVTYTTLKHYGLWMKSPATQLAEKKVLAEQVMKTLHGASCPLCGKNTYVESLDLWKTNTAILACENPKCLQKSMWKLEGYTWRLIAPYRYTPQPPIRLEAPAPEIEEEIKLEFS